MKLSKQFAKAVAFAVERHVEPRKQTSIPYISHLMSVSSLVLEFGGSEDEAIAALLHDVVEDTPTELEEVSALFGDVVAEIVGDCSEVKHDDGLNEERPWKDRKDDYIKRAQSKEISSSALLVSMADKLHNMQCILHDYRRIGDELWSRFNPTAGKEGTLWFYRTLANGFLAHPNANQGLAKELDIKVSELELLAL